MGTWLGVDGKWTLLGLAQAVANQVASLLPGSGAGLESSFSYAMPTSNFAVISPDGSDSNAGTVAAPVKTLSAALSKITTDGTIVLRAGSHHLGTGIASAASYNVNNVYGGVDCLLTKRCTVQSYPGETVYVDGSTDYSSGWTQGLTNGVTWWRKAITITLDRGATDTYGKLDNDSRGLGWLWVRSQTWHDLVIAQKSSNTEEMAQMFPLASWSEQLYLDGVEQQQVATLAELTAGEYYVEGTTGGTNGVLFTSAYYYLPANPAGHEVRVTDLCTSITTGPGGSGSTIRGIRFRRYANSNSQGAAVHARATTYYENCSIERASTTGFGCEEAAADGTTWTHCEANWCGNTGIGYFKSYNLAFRYVKAQNCNYRRFNWAPVSGGLKGNAGRNTVVDHCDFSYNWTKGFWNDVSNYNTVIANTKTDWNEQFGVVLEIGCTGVMANCTANNNGKDGLLLHDTSDFRFWNCAFVRNGRLAGRVYDSLSTRNIRIFSDDRRPVDGPYGTYPNYGRDSRQPVPDPTMKDWLIQAIEMKNCVTGLGTSQFGAIAIEDLNSSSGTFRRDWTAYGLVSNGNLFNRYNAANTWSFLLPLTSGQNLISGTAAATLSSWRSVTGQDAQSAYVESSELFDSDGWLTSAALATYGPSGNLNPAVAIPADIAALIGVSSGTRQVGPFAAATASVAAHTALLRSATTASPRRVSVVGDSIPYGAAIYGATPPKWQNSLVGILRSRDVVKNGDCGTGIVLFNQDQWPITARNGSIPDNSQWDTRMRVVGSITEPVGGLHGRGMWTVPDGGATLPADYVELEATAAEFWLWTYAAGSGVVRVSVDGAAPVRLANTASGGTIDVARDASTSGSYICSKIVMASTGNHVLRIWGDGGVANLWAWEGRLKSGAHPVDNLSISGRSLGSLVTSSPALRDSLTMLDVLPGDVVVLELGINDYNGGTALATAVGNLKTVLNRVKADGKTPVGILPPQPSGSLYVGNGAPTYTDYATAFTTGYADLSVPFLNLRTLWAPASGLTEQQVYEAGNSAGYYADSLHPSDKGAASIATAIADFLGI